MGAIVRSVFLILIDRMQLLKKVKEWRLRYLEEWRGAAENRSRNCREGRKRRRMSGVRRLTLQEHASIKVDLVDNPPNTAPRK